MALPLVRIVSAIAPVVLGAFDLYRRRREAKEGDRAVSKEFMRSPDGLQKRLQELEDADVEQARLISELSNNVEALATTLQREIDDGKKREAWMRQLLWMALSCAVASLALALWMAFR